ncbi:uncharacterized protein SPSK_04148 [Sporothrix schenckii 1099-18]|uniref:Uncharacterized protein n=1 Tax=Sporothrix schenckii 1099-18 TaxID=1397361 RepID=A0A0F2M074_SPOSC|nr:uncharacterized protein SPSK_04148 [Sporothrix schenckii 1099-18]KJR83107.1 hypothetical protein SPSK_04148 [Sporothrix schenckii 1099-18]
MPCFRGIEISLVAASDNSVFPEFPHPDGSSVRFGGLQSSRCSSAVFLSPRRCKPTDGHLSDEGQVHADPKISVYIPSAPDTNFYFRYVVNQAPVGHKYLFFQITISGRHVVSWGLDLAETMVGAAHQALFQPSTYYQHNDNGVIMTEYGIESRCFRFVTCGSAAASIANDGGLIQVQVFRARSRHRRAPQPDPYRGNYKYGVATRLISNGLLENPQMANFYDYHLIDAIDAPYATFQFHYRSWENLRLLQLAPSEKPPELLCASPAKTIDEELDSVGFDFSNNARGRAGNRLGASSDRDYVSTPSPSNFEVGKPAGQRKERPLPELPTASNHATGTGTLQEPKTKTEAEDDGKSFGSSSEDTHQAEEHRAQRVRKASGAPKSSDTSNIPIAGSLETHNESEGGLLVDAMDFGSAINKATERDSLNIVRKKGLRADEYGGPAFEKSKEDRDDKENKALQEITVPALERLAFSPLKPLPKTIFVAPFTDSLRKREMAPLPESPTRHRSRRVSHDPSLISPRGSGSKQKRVHGGSLDSRCQPLFDEEHLGAR